METKLAHVALDQIEVSATNKMFRAESEFTPAALKELADSISKSGVISPILLRPGKKKKYELICGERRYRAALLVMATEKDRKLIPANISELNDEAALEAQMIENLQREDINPMREAIAFKTLEKEHKISAAEIARRIGKSSDYVQERVKLASLHKDAQDLVSNGVLPLKAALKIARIPEEMHVKAINNCTTRIETAKGSTVTFTGLEQLQRWLNWHVFNELAYADFDTNDANLVPAAGSCLSCTKRTKNSGGLFDDIAKKDFCFDGGCFRQKQLKQYEHLKSEITRDFPGAEVVYRNRGYSTVDPAFKKLTPLLGGHIGNEISKSQAQKELADFDKGKDPQLKVAILVGVNRNMEGAEAKKKYVCLSFKKDVTGKGATGPARSPKVTEKEKADLAKQRKANELEEKLLAEASVKKFQTKTLSEKILQGLIVELLQETNNDEQIIEPLMQLGVKFKMSQYVDSKKSFLFNGKDRPADSEGYMIDNLEDIISTLKGEKLNAIAGITLSKCFYGSNQTKFFKEHGVDIKAIATKAKAQAAQWWKSEQEKKKSAVKTFVKAEGRKPGAAKKKK